MSVSLENVKETYEACKKDMLNNRQSTNEFVVDDLMQALGYNKKRDDSVIRAYEEDIDWKVVYPTGNRLIVRTFAAGNDIEIEKVNATFDYGANENFAAIIITNGADLQIYGINNVDKTYIQIADINILSDKLDETDEMILNSISKSGFDRSNIDKIVSEKYLTDAKVKVMLNDSIVDIVSIISANQNIKDTSSLKEILNKLFSCNETESNTDSSEVVRIENEELSNLKATKEQLELENKQLFEGKEQLESEKEQIKIENEQLASEKEQLINDKEQLEIELKGIREENEALRTTAENTVTINETVDNEELSNLRATKEQLEAEKEQLETELSNTKEELSNTKEELSNTKEELSSTKEEISSTKEEINNVNSEKQSLIESLNTEKEKVESLENEKNSILSEKAELEERVNNFDIEKQAYIEKADNEMKDTRSQVGQLQIQNKSLLEQIDSIQEKLDSKESEIEQLKSEIISKDEQVSEMRNKVSQLENSSVDDYIKQISNLTEERNILEEERNNLADKIKKMQDEIDDLAGMDKKKAQELLDVITVPDDAPRQYVGVVNTELFQKKELHKFVGYALQKLSEIKGSQAAQAIFDGDMFFLAQNGPRHDCMINNKYWDVDLSNIDEDEAINKLRVIFSHFSDITFECKKVGTLTESSEVAETNSTSVNDLVSTVEEKEFKFPGVGLFKKKEKKSILDEAEAVGNLGEAPEFNETENSGFDDSNGYTENTEYNDNSTGYVEENNNYTENSNNYTENSNEYVDNNTEYTENYTDNYSNEVISYILVTQLKAYTELTTAEAVLNKIRYIGTNDITFRITEEDDLDKTAARCIEALLAIEEYRNNLAIIKKAKMTNFSNISDKILRYTMDTREYAKIASVKYCVHGVESVSEILEMLYDICMSLDITMDDVFVYTVGNTESQNVINNFFFEETNIACYDNTEPHFEDNGEDIEAVIKGDILNSIIFTQNSLEIHSKTIKCALGIKTNYMANALTSFDDFKKSMETMIEAALKGGIDITNICRSTVLDGRCKLASTNRDDVSDNCVEINPNGTKMYLSVIDDWEIAEQLIKTHTEVFADARIAVKVKIRTYMYEFLNKEYSSSDPSSALAVLSFRNYINATKIGQK